MEISTSHEVGHLSAITAVHLELLSSEYVLAPFDLHMYICINSNQGFVPCPMEMDTFNSLL